MSTISVKCPACAEILEIDAATGTVVKHHREPKPKPGGDFLKERLKSLDEEKSRREEMVARSREKERTKKDAHDQLFSKVKKTAKDGPAERPLRDIDID